MAGRHGGLTSTVRNLTVVHINEATGEVLLSGPIPGHVNSMVIITKTGEKNNFAGIELMHTDKVLEVTAPVEEKAAEEVAPVAEEAQVENTASEEAADVKEDTTENK
jgi:hypothetical protein